MRISNSFSEGEIAVLDFIVTRLLRGYDPKVVVRHKDFASLMRKVKHMKARAEEERGGPLAALIEASEDGSGIVVRADIRPGDTTGMLDNVD